MKYDPKVLIWVVGIVFLAGGGWWSLQSMSADVGKIQQTLDEQTTQVAVHVSTPDAHDDSRIKRLETQQTAMGNDVKSLMINQNAICQATNARCR
jgi:predicted amino acid-binding ACT domain protein